MNDLHFAVCIGIDRYPGFPGRDLSSATKDATVFRNWLISPSGGALPPENAVLITVPANLAFSGLVDARPTMQEVLRALRAINDQIDRRLKANPADWARTRLYMYAAGHGIAVPKSEGALLMADAETEFLTFNVDLSLYADWYMRCGRVAEVVVFVDCCREVSKGMEPSVVYFASCDSPASKGTVQFVAYATRYGEEAFEPLSEGDPDDARGYFTEAVIDGLNGAAAEKESRQVTAASLSTYVADAVFNKTQPPAAPYPQRVRMPVDFGAPPLVLRSAQAAAAAAAGDAPPPPAKTHEATIRFPAGFAGAVVIRDTDEVEHGRWQAADGDWKVTLRDTYYRVVAVSPSATKFAEDGNFQLVGADRYVDL